VLRPRDHLLKIVFSSGDNSIFGATRMVSSSVAPKIAYVSI